MNREEKASKDLNYLVFYPKNIDKNKKYNIVFFMHGYGDSMHGISGIIEYLSKDNIYIFFNAPFKMDIGFNTVGYRWFEFPLNEREFKFSQEAISNSINEILIEFKFNFEKIYIGGFSQGGMMSLHNNYNGRVDGLIILSSRLVYSDKEFYLNNNTKIFMSHGLNDLVIPKENANYSLNFLKDKGFNIEYKEFQIAHEISIEQMNELNKWIDDE